MSNFNLYRIISDTNVIDLTINEIAVFVHWYSTLPSLTRKQLKYDTKGLGKSHINYRSVRQFRYVSVTFDEVLYNIERLIHARLFVSIMKLTKIQNKFLDNKFIFYLQCEQYV